VGGIDMYRGQNGIKLPLLGTLSNQQLKDMLGKTIIDEATAAEFYTRLLKETPDSLHYEFIQHTREDELEHLDHFEKLYYHYFGTRPQFRIEQVHYPNYKEGILMALRDELEAVEFYRDMQLSVKDPLVRDTYYLAMVDELEHATKFSTLYNQI
jgi:rubrerythrin